MSCVQAVKFDVFLQKALVKLVITASGMCVCVCVCVSRSPLWMCAIVGVCDMGAPLMCSCPQSRVSDQGSLRDWIQWNARLTALFIAPCVSLSMAAVDGIMAVDHFC